VGHDRPVHTDVVVVVEVEEFLPCELGAVVSDDRVGYAEALDDVDEERYDLLRADVDDGSSLDPLGELVDRHEKMCEAPGRLSERPHHVEVPHGERPCDGDSLERLRWQMGLSGIELAPLTTPYNVLEVRHRRGPVESLSESLPDKCSRACMMTACACVDLSQQLAALVSKDAPHECASSSSLVELTLDEDECLCSPRDASSLHLVRGQLPFDKAFKDRESLVGILEI
jgi:hypothetical protein